MTTSLSTFGTDRKVFRPFTRKYILKAALICVLPLNIMAQEQQNTGATEAENDPASILFPAGVPSPYYPSDDEIAKAANDRLENVISNSGQNLLDEVQEVENGNIDVIELEEEDGSAYGTLGPRQTGLARTIWQPSEQEKIEKLFAALTLPSTSPAMDDIARKLLLAIATAPTGEPFEVESDPQENSSFSNRRRTETVQTAQPFDEELLKSFVNLRLEKLMERGNLQDLVSYIQNLPEGMLEPSQKNAETLMLGGDLIGACQMTVDARNVAAERERQMNRFMAQSQNNGAEQEDIFWLKMLAFCRVLEGNNSGAQIAIDMLNEQGNNDFIYSDLLGRLMEDQAVRGTFLSRGLTSLEPLNYIILSLLDQPIDADLLEDSSPLITSALIINPNMSPENRFEAAVKSYGYGGVTADSLRNIYGLQEFTAMEYNNAMRMAEFDDRPIADALLFQAASREQNAFAKSQILDVIWERAKESNDLPRKAALNIETLSSINPSSELINHAHHIARGLILGEERGRAIEWYNFARRNAAGGDAEATRALINIWPLAIISNGEGAIPWSDSILTLWWNGQMVLSPENRESKAALFYAIAEAFGHEVSEEKWEDLITESRSEDVQAIPIAVWRDLIRSVGENKPGQSLVLGLIAMGQKGPGALDPTGISTIVRMLRSFGMEREARKVAIEALVANDF